MSGCAALPSTPPTNIPTMAPATAPDHQLMRCWLAISSRELRPSDSSGRSAGLCWPRPSLGGFQLLRSTPFGRSGKESELLAIALGQGGEQESERELLLLGAFLGGKLIMCVITHQSVSQSVSYFTVPPRAHPSANYLLSRGGDVSARAHTCVAWALGPVCGLRSAKASKQASKQV